MPALFLYLLKLTISLSIAWLFYRLLLRSLTFYNLNRWYLLGYSLLSFFIPFFNIGPIAADSNPVHPPFYIQLIPVVGNYTPPSALLSPAAAPGMSAWTFTGQGLLIGILALLTRTLIRWYSLARIKRKALLIGRDRGISIYEVDRPITPFSFGNSIFVNFRLHTKKEWEEIILHEYVHIRQHHTLDILLTEAITILNWYNPFAWTLRYSIRQNLEFIADQQVLANGVDKKEYQYHLLAVVGHPGYRLANNFNFSSLKKRIIMMNKIRSARLHLLRFLFLLPLLAVILLAFRDRYPDILHRKTGPVYVNAAGIVISLAHKERLVGVTVRENRTGLQATTDANGYFKLRIPVTTDSIRIHLDYSKQGYEAGMSERFWPRIKETSGCVDIEALSVLAPHKEEFFFVAPRFHWQPADPGYSDAVGELDRVFTENQQLKHQKEVSAAHADIGLFYVTEDKQRRLVIHTDGTVERFGYPGTPGLAEMDEKYGILPWMGPEGANTNAGYLDRWAAISAQAEKEFHPTGGNPKAIIFPGDSRVIAVSASGKVQIYDMDNTVDPKERPGFEKLYGKLPACVPETGTVPPAVFPQPKRPASAADTTPATPAAHASDTLPPGVRPFLPKKDPICIIDGVRMPDSINGLARLRPSDIASITVLKSEATTAKYGPDAAARGVLIITTKKPQKQP